MAVSRGPQKTQLIEFDNLTSRIDLPYMDSNSQLYNNILKSVSRSFFLSLKVLPREIRPAMGLGYLLCRTADTLADTEIIPLSQRRFALTEFKKLFDSFPVSPTHLRKYIENHLSSISLPPSPEGRLLQEMENSARAFNQLTKTDQALVQEVVQGVIKGMELDMDFFGDPSGKLMSLPSQEDLETYIQWIGGEPGRFWAQVSLAHGLPFKGVDRSKWIQHAVQFGKGLQMVNILRDLPEDLEKGRCYIPLDRLRKQNLTPDQLLSPQSLSPFLPLYHQMIDETVFRFRHGLEYIHQIPTGAWRLRAAVWWPLAIGMKTLGRLRQSPHILQKEARVKIKRRQIYGLVGSSVLTLRNDRVLKKDFDYLAEWASSKM